METLYKELVKIKSKVDIALTHVGLMDNCDTIAEAAFKAGRAYGPLDKANDELGELLDEMYNCNLDLDHWDDVINED